MIKSFQLKTKLKRWVLNPLSLRSWCSVAGCSRVSDSSGWNAASSWVLVRTLGTVTRGPQDTWGLTWWMQIHLSVHLIDENTQYSGSSARGVEADPTFDLCTASSTLTSKRNCCCLTWGMWKHSPATLCYATAFYCDAVRMWSPRSQIKGRKKFCFWWAG